MSGSIVHVAAVPWVFEQFGGYPPTSRILATPTPAVGTALRFLAGSQPSGWGLACQAGLAAYHSGTKLAGWPCVARLSHAVRAVKPGCAGLSCRLAVFALQGELCRSRRC